MRRALRTTQQGFQLLATAHARDAEEFVGLLAGYPLRVPLAEIAAFDLVVALEARRSGDGIERVVTGVWQLCRERQGESLALIDRMATNAGDGDWGRLGKCSIEEIRARAAVLTELVAEIRQGGADHKDITTRLAAAGQTFTFGVPATEPRSDPAEVDPA